MLYRAGMSVPLYEVGYLTITVKDKGAYWQVLQVATALQSPLLRLYATNILEQEQEPPPMLGRLLFSVTLLRKQSPTYEFHARG